MNVNLLDPFVHYIVITWGACEENRILEKYPNVRMISPPMGAYQHGLRLTST
jgi:hypothetical protein